VGSRAASSNQGSLASSRNPDKAGSRAANSNPASKTRSQDKAGKAAARVVRAAKTDKSARLPEETAKTKPRFGGIFLI
jgi:hypothetical protein